MEGLELYSSAERVSGAPFSLHATTLEFRSGNSVVCGDCKGNTLVLALRNSAVLFFSLDDFGDSRSYTIKLKDPRPLHEVFLSDCENFVVVSSAGGETFFMDRSRSAVDPSFTPVKDLHDVVSAVGWNGERDSSQFLVGTQTGDVYLARVGGGSLLLSKVFTAKEAILGIAIIDRGASMGSHDLYGVVVTHSGFYQFSGDGSLEELFLDPETRFKEFSSGVDWPVAAQHCRFFLLRGLEATTVGMAFPNFGVSHIVPRTSIIVNKVIDYPKHVIPPQIALTKFHYILLYPTVLYCISRETNQRVFEAAPPRAREAFLGFLSKEYDEIESSKLLIYTTDGVLELHVSPDEGGYLWKHFLDRLNFAEAISVTRNMPSERKIVLLTYAHHLFEKGEYRRASEAYIESGVPYELVVDRYSYPENRDFFFEFFRSLAARGSEYTDHTIHLLYAMDILLENILEAEKAESDDRDDLVECMKDFLKEHHETLNERVAVSLFRKHGREDFLTTYYLLRNDHESVIKGCIRTGDSVGALKYILWSKRRDLVSRYSPLLLFSVPKLTIDMWKRFPGLTSSDILPALLRYESSNKDLGVVIEYLEYLVHKRGNTDPPIHDYLVHLYCKTRSESSLLYFLQLDILGRKYYDMDTALRLAKRHSLVRPMAYLLSEMGLFDEAVDLLLRPESTDIDTAIMYISKCEDKATKRRLWLKIVKVISREGVEVVSNVIARSEGLLGIEEAFTLMGKSLKLKDMKEEITRFFRESESEKRELAELMRKVEEINRDIHKERAEHQRNYTIVKPANLCDLCGNQLGSDTPIRDIVVYPCEHRFHKLCVWRFYLDPERVKYRQNPCGALTVFERKRVDKILGGKRVSESLLGNRELQELLAGRGCPVCGRVNLEMVSREYGGVEKWRI